jgi:phage terminase Nu1 subunit (DNA packaging protein)
MPTKREPKTDDPSLLKGWKQIATFLGLPVSAAQRWAQSGMPVTREGQLVVASPDEINRWLGRETSEPVHIATDSADLSAELRRGLSFVKTQKQHHKHPDTERKPKKSAA